MTRTAKITIIVLLVLFVPVVLATPGVLDFLSVFLKTAVHYVTGNPPLWMLAGLFALVIVTAVFRGPIGSAIALIGRHRTAAVITALAALGIAAIVAPSIIAAVALAVTELGLGLMEWIFALAVACAAVLIAKSLLGGVRSDGPQ